MRKIYYFIFLCIALPSFLAGCNKDEAESEPVTPALTPMHKMYNESVTLTEAILDSITSFRCQGTVPCHPIAKGVDVSAVYDGVEISFKRKIKLNEDKTKVIFA